MLMLSSQEWMDYYARRNRARTVVAQIEGDPPDILPEPVAPEIRYYWARDEQGRPYLRHFQIPMLAGNPMTGFPEGLGATRRFRTIRRPLADSPELPGWQQIFEANPEQYGYAEGVPYGIGQKLPPELYGSPKNRRWWSRALSQAMGRGENPEEEGIPHPSLRTERNLPSEQHRGYQFTDFGRKNELYTRTNDLLMDMVQRLHHAGDPNTPEAERAKDLKFIQDIINPPRMKRGEDQLTMVIDGLARDRAYFMLEQRNVPPEVVERMEPAVDSMANIAARRAMGRFFGLYYDSGYDETVEDKKKAAVAPMVYIIGQIDEELRAKNMLPAAINEEMAKVELDKPMGKERSAVDMLASPEVEENFDEMMQRETDTQEQKLRDIIGYRKDLLSPRMVQARHGLTPEEYEVFVGQLNRGFGEFIGRAGVQLPTGELDLLAELVRGDPKINVAAENPVPDSLCTNCGQAYFRANDGGILPAMVRKGDNWVCQNPGCRAPKMRGGGAQRQPIVEGDQMSMGPFSETGQQHINTTGLLTRFLLAYLETQRQVQQDPDPQKDIEKRKVITDMMVGIPITIERSEEPAGTQVVTRPLGHGNFMRAVSVPIHGEIVVRPLIYSGARRLGTPIKGREETDDIKRKRELELRTVRDLGLNFRGWGIGELVRGMGFPTTQVGGEFDAPVSAYRGYQSHPAAIAKQVALQNIARAPIELPADQAGIDITRTPKQMSGQTERMKREREKTIRAYNVALSNAAMWMLNLRGTYGEGEQEEAYLNGWAHNIANSPSVQGDLDVGRVADDIRSMMQFIESSGERDAAGNVENPISQELIQQYNNIPDDEPLKQEMLSVIGEEWQKDKDGALADTIDQFHQASEQVKENSFSLGWSIIGNAAKKLRDLIGVLAGGAPLKDKLAPSPLALGRPTLEPTLERQFGFTPGTKEEPRRFRSDEKEFREELAMSMTGLFGFGGRYDGNYGVLTQLLGPSDPIFSVQFQASPEQLAAAGDRAPMVQRQVAGTMLPDGGHMLFVGQSGYPIQAFKTTDQAETVDAEGKPKIDWEETWAANIKFFPDEKEAGTPSFPPEYDVSAGGFPVGTPFIVDEYISEIVPKPGGGKEVRYQRSDHFSPESIAERRGIDPDQVRQLSTALLRSGVDQMFEQARDSYDPNSVTKEIFSTLLPMPLHMFFMQQTWQQFLGRGQIESYQTATAKAVQFCSEVGNAIVAEGLHGDELRTRMGAIQQKYGIPAYLMLQVANEMARRWGPSYRTYQVAVDHPREVGRLATEFKVGKRQSSGHEAAMMRMASLSVPIRGTGMGRQATLVRSAGGVGRWQRVILTG